MENEFSCDILRFALKTKQKIGKIIGSEIQCAKTQTNVLKILKKCCIIKN